MAARRAVRPATALVLGLVLALWVSGCGGGGASSAGPTPEATSGTETSAVESVETTGAPETPEATTIAEEPPCDAADFLPVLKKAFDGTAPKLEVVRADVKRCRNGYAQVYAVPDDSVCDPGVGYCYETEQVFLQWRGEWRILTSGTGISCGSETEPLLVRICGALGYPALSTPAFQMPSKNIGCMTNGRYLRCDILSGLEPEPGQCELDWVGVLLPRDGEAVPNCAGDTVYEKTAPTLGYGSTWRSRGFTCQSRETGLSCTSRAGHGFTLSREAWTAS
jgi:hypothetical protein